MTTTFDALPVEARLWVFACDRTLTESDARTVTQRLEAFTETWTSHTRPVEAAVSVADGRFVIVAAQIPGGDVSGCGTDKLFHAVEGALVAVGAAQAPALSVTYQSADGALRAVSRAEFKQLTSAESVQPQTLVYDASLTTLGELRRRGLLVPAQQTWMNRYFATVGA